MALRDIYLSKTTHDLELKGRDLQIVDGSKAISQKLTIKLKTFFQEWFLNQLVGIKYYSDLFKKNPNIPKIENEIKVAISETEGVREIVSFNIAFNAQSRELSLSFVVNTIDGIVTIDKLVVQS